MVYNITDLVTYARSKDERLEDLDKYPDSIIHDFIEEGFAIAQDIRPIFAATEKYDLYSSVVTDGLTEFEIILTKEPHTIWLIEGYDSACFEYEVTANNHIIVRKKVSSGTPTTYEFVVKYFFYPVMPLTTIELSMDAYRLIKETIAAALFGALRDLEQEKYHKDKAHSMAVESAYDLEKGTLDVPDTKLWEGTWV